MKRVILIIALLLLAAPAYAQSFEANAVQVVGANAAIGTSFTIVADTVGVAIPSAASTIEVVSTSTSDAAAGTGIRTVRVTGLDANYAALTEDFTLDGTTAAVSTGSFLRINLVKALTAGSGGAAAGTIDVRSGAGTIFARITLGENESKTALYTVAAGDFAEINDIFVSAVTQPAKFLVKVRPYGGVFETVKAANVSGNASLLPSGHVLTIPPKADVAIYGAATTSTAAVAASFMVKSKK